MHDRLPLVTVGIPTYNSARYLRQCLDSILAQTYRNIEIIIADNASTDGTLAIAEDYRRTRGIRLIRHASNIGAGNNFNSLIGAASGDYVALYHSDDIYDPTIVERCVQVLKDDAAIGLVGTMASVIDKHGRKVRSLSLPPELKKIGQTHFTLDDTFLGLLRQTRHHYFFVTPSIMVRKDAYQELGTFRIHDQYRSAGDYEMWLRIAANRPVAIIDKDLMGYRVHTGQGTEREVRMHGGIPDIVPVLDEYSGKVDRHELQMMWKHARQRLLIATALRLNALRMFDESSKLALLTNRGPTVRCLRFLNSRRIPIGTLVYDMIVSIGRAVMVMRDRIVQLIGRS